MVSDELDGEITVEGILGTREINLDRVVDHEVNGDKRLDDGGIGSGLGCGIAHGGEIDDERHAGEILEDDPGNRKGNLVVAGGLGVPVGKVFNVGLGDLSSVEITEEGFQNDANGDRKAGDVGYAKVFESGEGVVGGCGAGAGGEGFERVHK